MESITGGNTPKYQELTEQLRLHAFRTVSGQPSDGAQGIGDFTE